MDKRFQKQEEFKRNEAGIKHQIRQLIKYAGNWQQNQTSSAGDQNRSTPSLELLIMAKKIARLQQIKEQNLGEELSDLGEPLWKILIQLLIANEAEKKITVADLSERVSLPQSTVLRYINILIERAYVLPSGQQISGDSYCLQLTDEGQSMMRKTLLEFDSI